MVRTVLATGMMNVDVTQKERMPNMNAALEDMLQTYVHKLLPEVIPNTRFVKMIMENMQLVFIKIWRNLKTTVVVVHHLR